MRSETRLRFYVDNTMIYHFYFGEFELGKKYSAPWRNDSQPSLVFKNMGSWSNQKILWFDFGLIDIPHHDGIGFVQQLYDISRKNAVRKIWREIVKNPDITLVKPRVSQPIKLPYEYTIQDIQDFEMKYWSKLWFTKEFLKFFNVHSMRSMRRLGKKLWGTTKENPTFIYLFSKTKAFKAYRPLDPRKDKFRGQNNGDVLEGYDQLPRSHSHLIICSSLKDSMVLRKLGYCTCNPTSENSKRGLYKYIRELNQRFSKIYILFDNDRPGIRAAKSLSRDTGWKIMNFPNWYGKDPSDNVMNSGNYLQLSIWFDRFNLNKIHIKK